MKIESLLDNRMSMPNNNASNVKVLHIITGLGTGGGGFLLFYCNPENHEKVIDVLRPLLHVPFRFEKNGTHVIFCEPDNSYEL